MTKCSSTQIFARASKLKMPGIKWVGGGYQTLKTLKGRLASRVLGGGTRHIFITRYDTMNQHKKRCFSKMIFMYLDVHFPIAIKYFHVFEYMGGEVSIWQTLIIFSFIGWFLECAGGRPVFDYVKKHEITARHRKAPKMSMCRFAIFNMEFFDKFEIKLTFFLTST